MSSSLHCYTSLWKLGAGFLLFRTWRQVLLSLLEAIRNLILWLVLWNLDFKSILKLLLFLIIKLSLFLNIRAHDVWRHRSRILCCILASLASWSLSFSKGKITLGYLHILHLFSILVLRNSERFIFVIKHILIIIFEIKFVNFVLIQILCLIQLLFSARLNVRSLTTINSSGADSTCLLRSWWNTAARSRDASGDSGRRSVIWNIHLVSMLIQFIWLKFVMLFRIFRSLMKRPT